MIEDGCEQSSSPNDGFWTSLESVGDGPVANLTWTQSNAYTAKSAFISGSSPKNDEIVMNFFRKVTADVQKMTAEYKMSADYI